MTPNPWERLREVVKTVLAYLPDGKSTALVPDYAFTWLREALAALPATPPQQPVPDDKVADLLAENAKLRAEIGALESRVPDEERERAIEEWDKMLLDANNAGKPGIIDYCRRKGVALMRSAPAPLTFNGVPVITDGALDHNWPPKPVPAPPASDWRERFDRWVKAGSLWDTIEAMHDGLAALEAEVAKLKEKP